MAVDVGVNVIEVDGRASPTIQAAATSVAAFLGLTERGIPNRPVRLTNLPQFRERFGNHRTDGYLSYSVEGFFLNGGREAYINRVVGASSVAASVVLGNRAATSTPALRITAGYRGQQDPGPWGNRLRLDVRDDPIGNTQLQGPTVANATTATLQSLRGFQVGSVARFVNGATVFYRRITAVNAAAVTISWTTAIAPVLPGTALPRLPLRSSALPSGIKQPRLLPSPWSKSGPS